MGFGEKLRIILELHDIKVYNLASYLGYDASYISKWMTGSKMPSSKHIRKINRDIGEFCAKEGTSAQKKETLAMLKSDIDYTNFDAYATAISKYLSDSDEISEITPPPIRKSIVSIDVRERLYFRSKTPGLSFDIQDSAQPDQLYRMHLRHDPARIYGRVQGSAGFIF